MTAFLLDELAVRAGWIVLVAAVVRLAIEVAVAHFAAARYRARSTGRSASGTSLDVFPPATRDPGRPARRPYPRPIWRTLDRPADWDRDGWL